MGRVWEGQGTSRDGGVWVLDVREGALVTSLSLPSTHDLSSSSSPLCKVLTVSSHFRDQTWDRLCPFHVLSNPPTLKTGLV